MANKWLIMYLNELLFTSWQIVKTLWMLSERPVQKLIQITERSIWSFPKHVTFERSETNCNI